MPSMTAVKILSEFSIAGFVLSCWAHIKTTLITDVIIELLWIFLYILHIFNYLNISALWCLRSFCGPLSLKQGSLRPKAVSKLPGVFLCLHCMSRGPVCRDTGRKRPGLLGMCGIGWSVKWLLTNLRKPSEGCWLALSIVTAARGFIITLSWVDTEAGFLLFHWVTGLSHLRAKIKIHLFSYFEIKNWNPACLGFLFISDHNVLMVSKSENHTLHLQLCMDMIWVHSVSLQGQVQEQVCYCHTAGMEQMMG